MIQRTCIVFISLLGSFCPLGMAMLNLTLPHHHPNPEAVAQDVQRYINLLTTLFSYYPSLYMSIFWVKLYIILFFRRCYMGFSAFLALFVVVTDFFILKWKSNILSLYGFAFSSLWDGFLRSILLAFKYFSYFALLGKKKRKQKTETKSTKFQADYPTLFMSKAVFTFPWCFYNFDNKIHLFLLNVNRLPESYIV